MRPTWAEIDLDALRGNVRRVAELVAPAQVCAVVKADGYGHGDVPVAEAALDAGASTLAVALVEEGIRLREAGIRAPILLLSEPVTEDLPTVVEWDLVPTVYHESIIDRLIETAERDDPIEVQIKIDTGMHRVGATVEEAERIRDKVLGHPHLRLGAIWTHFAVADEDVEFTQKQIDLFGGAVGEGDETDAVVTHLANTAGALAFPGARADMVRLGIGMYGYHPSDVTTDTVELQPVMRLVSQVTHVARHPAGTRPSYGRRRALETDSTVATVPIGYADGVPRLLSSREGEVLIRGRRFPLAGTVTMDQIVVDVGDEPVEVGDEVVLLGAQGAETITADHWARALDTISYEIVCGVGPRVPRRYVDSESEVVPQVGGDRVQASPEKHVGTLHLSDGTEKTLTRSAVIGRHPETSRAVRGGGADAIEVTHENVAPTHCVIHVEDGATSVVDLDSANGTMVSRGDDHYWLESEKPFSLENGDALLIGGQKITWTTREDDS